MFRNVVLIFTFIFVFQIVGIAQSSEPLKDSRYYERQGIAAYQAKDFAGFLENLKQADSLNPNHPRITYNLAIAYTLNNKNDEAISSLNKLAEMKLYYSIEKAQHFEPLKTNNEFQNVVKKMEANSQPVGKSQTAFTIPEKGLVAESLAFDSVTKNFYLASIAQRKILKIDENGKASVFADQNAGLWSVSGTKIDAKNQVIWVTTTAHKQMPDLKAEENGMTGVFKFDLKTGKLLKKYLVSNQSKERWLGDLSIAPNGDVYATDSLSPTIYMIPKNKDEIEVFLENTDFTSPQGLDITPDGKTLLMADYSKGVFKIDLETKKITRITLAENSTMLGIDGLYFYQNSLIAVQNGVNPQRLVRMFLSKDLEKVERFEVLEANNPLFDDITLGVLVGKQFYFIANSQWNLLDDGGKFKTLEKLKDAIILKVEL